MCLITCSRVLPSLLVLNQWIKQFSLYALAPQCSKPLALKFLSFACIQLFQLSAAHVHIIILPSLLYSQSLIMRHLSFQPYYSQSVEQHCSNQPSKLSSVCQCTMTSSISALHQGSSVNATTALCSNAFSSSVIYLTF